MWIAALKCEIVSNAELPQSSTGLDFHTYSRLPTYDPTAVGEVLAKFALRFHILLCAARSLSLPLSTMVPHAEHITPSFKGNPFSYMYVHKHNTRCVKPERSAKEDRQPSLALQSCVVLYLLSALQHTNSVKTQPGMDLLPPPPHKHTHPSISAFSSISTPTIPFSFQKSFFYFNLINCRHKITVLRSVSKVSQHI